ncbi:MAG: SUF system Fe-S cluster assembly regulator [Deltaproteobacteria bacterium]|nr:SUF system Fe-S cluster assembly regulator [Deltaproteobacteria bacterium]
MMLRLSKMADYGLVLLTYFARESDRWLAARELAVRSHVPFPTASKILKALSKAQLLESERGTNGGYRLSRPADQISIADVVSVFERPVALTACLETPHSCSLEPKCPVRSHLRRISHATSRLFETITLAQFSSPFPLEETAVLMPQRKVMEV